MRPPFYRTFIEIFRELNLKKALQKENWQFSEFRKQMILSETEDWVHSYLPIEIKNKIVMTVGAGEGEDSRFFLKHGASKTVAIEINPIAFKLLNENAKHHNILPINEPFDLNHLNIPHDFLKMDIEGYEEILLTTKLKTPAVVEIHGLQLVERFRRAGWRITEGYGVMHGDQRTFARCCKYGYWMC